MDTAGPGRLAASKATFTVTGLAEAVRDLLDDAFPLVTVEGEISNLAQPASGHLYFTLKDARSQIRCAMFRNRRRQVRSTPANGDQVRVRAKVGLYTVRGDFQLIVEHMEPAGEGALQLAFERLRRRLEAEGLFSPEHKRPLPEFPRRLGVVTSTSGAALRDILHVLRRRHPRLPILVYPTPVQGEAAPAGLLAALERATTEPLCDVLILARGGGSLEDLQAFNDEGLARAIAGSPIPVVTGIGHETDFTIADFVADLRAPTPSAAAEVATPDRRELQARVESNLRRLARLAVGQLRQSQQSLDWLDKRLLALHPGRQTALRRQRLGYLEQALRNSWLLRLQQRRTALNESTRRLEHCSPRERLLLGRGRNVEMEQRLRVAMDRRLRDLGARLGLAGKSLDSVSPLSTLERGYAIVTSDPGARVITRAAELSVGDKVKTRLAEGMLSCTVDEAIDQL